MIQIDLNLPTESYPIMIDRGLLKRLGRVALDVAPHSKCLLAVDSQLVETHAKVAEASLRSQGYHVVTQPVVADERHKTLESVRDLYDAMLASRHERGSPVIALGGGVTGDVAGFAAATYLRGVPLIQVPTTLLAMVDASIGGKTGVNLPTSTPGETLVKNIVGAFWQPDAVVIDPETLRTLDPRHFRCGLAECVKHAMIADADLLTFIADRVKLIMSLDMKTITELIERSVRVKAAIVMADEREAGDRALLNLGHTFAHVIEPIESLDLQHGEAVAIGLVAATRCAVAAGRINEGDALHIADLLGLLGLPTALPSPIDAQRLIEAMGHDKKVKDGRLRLVLPRGLGAAEIVSSIAPAIVLDAWSAVGAKAPASDARESSA